MSDTTVFGKIIPGTAKACFLYVMADACMSIGQACLTMKAEDWQAMSGLNQFGWAMLQIGGVFLFIKAFYSKSSTKTQ